MGVYKVGVFYDDLDRGGGFGVFVVNRNILDFDRKF